MNNQNIYGIVKSKVMRYSKRDGLSFFLCEFENKIKPIYISENKIMDIELKPNQRVLINSFKKDNMVFVKNIKLM